MRTRRQLLGFGAVAWLVAGCASFAAPDAEIRASVAPTGRLRVALLEGAPANMIRLGNGDAAGVGHDLGRELARRLGVPFEAVMYPGVAQLLDDAKAGKWDVSFNGITPERAAFLDFTSPHLEIEFGYLVPGASRVMSLADVDQPGIRVAVPERGAADVLLTGRLRQATIVRATGLGGVMRALQAGSADVIAANKPNLYQLARQLPGSQVLAGSYGAEIQALLMPKGRPVAALRFVRSFVDEAKAAGHVARAIERAGLRGAVVSSRRD